MRPGLLEPFTQVSLLVLYALLLSRASTEFHIDQSEILLVIEMCIPLEPREPLVETSEDGFGELRELDSALRCEGVAFWDWSSTPGSPRTFCRRRLTDHLICGHVEEIKNEI